MTAERKATLFEWLVRWMCFFLFVGHGLVTLQGRFSLRAFFFNENWMTGRAENWFGMSWDKWVTDEMVGARIDLLSNCLALLFLLIAIFCLVPGRRWWTLASYLLGGSLLVFVSVIRFVEAPVGVGMFLEHTGQFLSPFLLFIVACCGWSRRTEGLARVAIAFTFFFHGLFAFGLTGESLGIANAPLWFEHPTPASFVYMTMECFGLGNEGAALRILRIAGILDFAAAFLILIPRAPVVIPLLWMLVWGFLTALARPWTYYNATEPLETLWTWVPEMLLRTPHFALPLLLLLRRFYARPLPSPPKKKHAPKKSLIHEKPRVSTIPPFPDVRDLVPPSGDSS